MIDRIMLFKLVDASTRQEFVELLKRDLGQLPDLTVVTVGLPADEASAKSWDVSCVLRFEHLRDLEAALASQAFQTCLEGALAPRCVVVKAWSFAQA